LEVDPNNSPRLALCANVFPAQNAAQAIESLNGAMRKVVGQLPTHIKGNISYGLYLSYQTCCEFEEHPQLLTEYAAALSDLDLQVTTANAFPFGDFHAQHVKEKVFLPDWRQQQRVDYTCKVADLLAELATDASGLSISTCPFGYNSDAADTSSLENVKQVVSHLKDIHQQSGKHIRLAFEAEPCACFSDSVPLIDFLAENFTAEQLLYLGICFDLCHSAVTGEDYQQVLDRAAQQKVSIAKVQISSALERNTVLCEDSYGDVQQLSRSAYFHQTAVSLGEDSRLYPDIEDVPAEVVKKADEWRIHCHVPVCHDAYSGGWSGTAWRPAVQAAMAAKISNFEVETYTLNLLNSKFVQNSSIEDCIAAEICAGFSAIGLDTDAR
jgi:hypothetical protein